MEALSVSHKSFPIEAARRARKWEIQEHCTLKASHGISKRKLLLNSVTIGAAVMIKSPALSESLQQAKKPQSNSDIKKLDSGVKFEDVVAGEGAEAKLGNRVEFNYVCRRSNGYFVFSTVDQFTGESNPVTLLLDENEVIEGLKEVLVGMKVGGKRRALIPPSVGYVKENLKPIPAEFGPRRSLLSHATESLVFEVQLLKIL